MQGSARVGEGLIRIRLLRRIEWCRARSCGMSIAISIYKTLFQMQDSKKVNNSGGVKELKYFTK